MLIIRNREKINKIRINNIIDTHLITFSLGGVYFFYLMSNIIFFKLNAE